MSLVKPTLEDVEAEKAVWLDELDALVTHVKGWVEATGWETRQTVKSVTEPGLGRFEVPILLMKRGDVEVVLSPLGRAEPSAGGEVDFYLMPAYDDLLRLSFEGGRWSFRPILPPDPTAPRPPVGAVRPSAALDGETLNRVLDAAGPRA